jgi:putative glutamine amidotransferase
MNSSIPSRRPPVVLVPACNRMLGQHPFHVAGQKYVDAVRLAGALPLVVPSASREELDALLDLADGVLLTGSPSNVHPSHFGQPVHDDTLPLDPARDDWTLPLIPKLVARGMPLLAICRGFQEVNVALGGTLHQAVQEVDGLADHRSRSEDPVEVQYGPAHPVHLAPEGLMARALGTLGRPADIVVNSVHGQGVSRLAEGLNIEARAPDGLVEAFSIGGHPQGPVFQLAVQWHPEWQAASNPVSMALLRAFGLACQDYRDLHRPPSR